MNGDLDGAFGPLAEAWLGFELEPTDQLEIIQRSLHTAVSLIRSNTANNLLLLPLDELAFSLEKLAAKGEGPIREFLKRDDLRGQSTPAVEMRAHSILAFEIFASVPGLSKTKAKQRAVDAYAGFGARTVSSLERWRTILPSDPICLARVNELKIKAKDAGLFGLPLSQADARVAELASQAIRVLGPRDEPENF